MAIFYIQAGDKLRPVIFFGVVPPPLTGMTYITRLLRDRLRASGIGIVDLSYSLEGRFKSFKKLMAYVAFCFKLFFLRVLGVSSKVYFIAESDRGLFFTVSVVVAARLTRTDAILHHHVYKYVNDFSRIMRLICLIGGNRLTHIFLDETMGSDFFSKYRPGKALVLDNFGFMYGEYADKFHVNGARFRTGTCGLSVGYLSNITKEKGGLIVCDVMEEVLRSRGDVVFNIAGPINDYEINKRLAGIVADFGERVIYWGSIDGERKIDFFNKIDVFLFPTIYKNEAQPLVLYEALIARCLVLTTRRGCIVRQIHGYGVSYSDEEYVKGVGAVLTNMVSPWASGSSLEREGYQSLINSRLKKDGAAWKNFINLLG